MVSSVLKWTQPRLAMATLGDSWVLLTSPTMCKNIQHILNILFHRSPAKWPDLFQVQSAWSSSGCWERRLLFFWGVRLCWGLWVPHLHQWDNHFIRSWGHMRGFQLWCCLISLRFLCVGGMHYLFSLTSWKACLLILHRIRIYYIFGIYHVSVMTRQFYLQPKTGLVVKRCSHVIEKLCSLGKLKDQPKKSKATSFSRFESSI